MVNKLNLSIILSFLLIFGIAAYLIIPSSFMPLNLTQNFTFPIQNLTIPTQRLPDRNQMLCQWLYFNNFSSFYDPILNVTWHRIDRYCFYIEPLS
jgi:hypothetical protein